MALRSVILALTAAIDVGLPSISTVFAGNPANATLDAFWEIDVVTFELETSVADTIVLCCLRGLLIYCCFCCDGAMRTAARLVSILSGVYLLVKVSICENWDFAYTYIIYIAVLTSGVLQGIFLDRPVNLCCKGKGVDAAEAKYKAVTAGDLESGSERRLLDPLAGADASTGKASGGGATKDEDDSEGEKPKVKTVHACRLVKLAGPEKWILVAGTLCLIGASVGLMLVPSKFGELIKLIANNTAPQDVSSHLAELQINVLYLLLINLSAFSSFLCRSPSVPWLRGILPAKSFHFALNCVRWLCFPCARVLSYLAQARLFSVSCAVVCSSSLASDWSPASE